MSFFDTIEEAEAHQLHILTTWQSGALADRDRIGAMEMSRVRRSSKALATGA